jgi:hypothetical protein
MSNKQSFGRINKGNFYLIIYRKQVIISFLMRALCVYAHMIEPFIPKTSARVYYLLGL